MAGGGSSELRRVAAEMLQLAAAVRVLRDEQRALAARVAQLESQMGAKVTRAAERAAGDVAAEAAGEAGKARSAPSRRRRGASRKAG